MRQVARTAVGPAARRGGRRRRLSRPRPQQTAVSGEGEGDAVVAGPFRHFADVAAGGHQNGHETVPEPVERDVVEAGALDGGPQHRLGERPEERTAGRGGEHQVVGPDADELVEMLLDPGHHQPGDGNGPPRARRLRFVGESDDSADLDGRARDADPRAQRIYVPTPQTRRLTPPQPGVRTDQDQGLVAGPGRRSCP